MTTARARTEKLDLRLSADAKRRLKMAAAANQRSMSDFVLESALARADEALTGRRFTLDDQAWADFQQALDAPVRALPRLARLLSDSQASPHP